MKSILPSEVLSQHIAVLGKTGSGKTSTVKLIIEQLLRKDPSARVCILDPLKSDHWGLTRTADGKGKGLPFYVLGGPMGHVPLSASAGAALGQVVASGALQLSILDMADFDMGEHAKFFITFAQALFRNMQGVVHLVVEEAHVFAPKERSGYGEENKSTYWMKKMATGARSKGVRMIPSTQRTQELHNAVLGSCDTIIVHRITLPADQEPVAKWLAGNIGKEKAAEITASFSSLKTGEGWICSGEAQIMERRTFPRITTYDNSRTPEAGDRGKEIRPAPVDEDSLRTIIGSAVEEAKANDPAELKRRIAELERQVKAAPVVKVAAPEVKRVEVKVIRPAEVTRLEKLEEKCDAKVIQLSELVKEFEGMRDALRNVRKAFADQTQAEQRAHSFKPTAAIRQVADRVRKIDGLPPVIRNPRNAESNGDGRLPDGERRILTATAQYPNGADRSQLTILTGYKRSTRDRYLQRLAGRGFVDVSGDRILATANGVHALGDFEPLPTGRNLREYWLAKLPEGERAILEILGDERPIDVDREYISERTGYKRSTRDRYLQRLASRRLVEDAGPGMVRASAELFE